MNKVVVCYTCKRVRDELGNYKGEPLTEEARKGLLNEGKVIETGECPACQLDEAEEQKAV